MGMFEGMKNFFEHKPEPAEAEPEIIGVEAVDPVTGGALEKDVVHYPDKIAQEEVNRLETGGRTAPDVTDISMPQERGNGASAILENPIVVETSLEDRKSRMTSVIDDVIKRFSIKPEELQDDKLIQKDGLFMKEMLRMGTISQQEADDSSTHEILVALVDERARESAADEEYRRKTGSVLPRKAA